MELALTFDDVQIVPSYSEIISREEIDLTTQFTTNYSLRVPIVASCMDTVTELDMAFRMMELGGVGVVHRFMSIEEQTDIIKILASATASAHFQNIWRKLNIPIAAAIGVTGDYLERAEALTKAGCNVLVVDVANGHTSLMKQALKKLSQLPFTFDIVAGNIVTGLAYSELVEWGANGVRVGIGGGSMCLTRINTGIGVPQITAIKNCETNHFLNPTPIISDGGIRYPGDVCKAIGAGANTVMLGSLLAGTKESPGRIEKTGEWPNEQLYKRFRGSASLETKIAHGMNEKHVEGASQLLPYKGKVERIVSDITDGLRSAMSYVGARTIAEFQQKAQLIRVTENGRVEATAHGILK